MPLENTHTARQMSPDDCDSIRQKDITDGVTANICISKSGKASKIQSVHFDAKKFSPEEAKAWLKKNGFSADEFIPAKTKAAAETAIIADGSAMKDVSKCPRGAECPMMPEGDGMGGCGVPGIHAVNLAAAGLPTTLNLAAGPLELQAAVEEGGVKKRACAMTAYTGSAMKLPGFAYPVVVDLGGMKLASQRLPILRQHDPERIIGSTSGVEVSAQRLKAQGSLVGLSAAGQEVLALAAANFPWQVSLGADVSQMEFIDKGATAKANGRNFDGPAYMARGTVLRELSIVPMGADPGTSAAIAGEGAPELAPEVVTNEE